MGWTTSKRSLLLTLTLGPAVALAGMASAGEPVKGAGSTFAEKIVTAWAADSGGGVSYEGVGSGAGRAKLVAGEVDFAGSDSPAKDEERQALAPKGGAVHVPVTAGGLGIVYNVEGLGLTVSGPTLAKIFAGKITKWNDAAITADSGAPGPDLPITVVFRSDKSGSTGTLTGYLSAAGGGAWGGGTTEQWPAGPGQQGAEGGSGMAAAVAGTAGAIGYVDHGTARDKKLAEAKVKNGSGQASGPDAAAVTAALDAAATNDADGTVAVDYQAGGKAYPITSLSYVITTGKVPGARHETLQAFLAHALGAGQDKADPLGYAPLPAKLRSFAKAQAAKVQAG